MAHKHPVYDTDTHFTINPITRALRNEASSKTRVIQFDHNSERFTFEIPKMVEDHDMSLCNMVQVHYINIDSQTKEQKAGVYDVDDLQISPENSDVVILSWLISQNATQLVGSLNFLIRFACIADDGTVDYAWHTAVYGDISVSSGIYNGDVIVEEYADILAQWEARIEALEQGGGSVGDAVLYTEQTLTPEQKRQARENIGAVSADEIPECGGSDISDLTEEERQGTNILPTAQESGYYDGTTPMNSTRHIRTPEPIAIESGHKYLVGSSNLPNEVDPDHRVCIIWLDEAGTKISAPSKKVNQLINKDSSLFEIPSNAKSFLLWVSGVNTSGATMANFCLQYGNLLYPDYEPYLEPKTVIKKEVLPYGVSLCGKTIVNFGDSIFGRQRPPEDISTELAKLTGATVHNCGFGGCRMAKHSDARYDAFSMYRLADAVVSGDWSLQDAGIADTTQPALPVYFSEGLAILKGLNFADVDIITIAYGTNDFTSSVSLVKEDAKDTTSFAGALRYSVETLLNAYPHLKIFVCSQTYRFWMDESNVFTEDSDTYTNIDGEKLTDFVAKTEEVAKEYHLPYINNYDIGMNKYNRSLYFPATDGTHPLTTGCHLIAQHIAKELF